jgi:monofunctional biosynthetic peptidoglycan transglycosylase
MKRWQILWQWLGLLLLASLALQLFFAGRIAMMLVWDPQSTSFQRSEAWRLAHSDKALAWRQQWALRFWGHE